MKAYAYAAVAAVALALLAWATVSVYGAGKQAGTDACEQAHADAADKARVETERREVASSYATGTMLDYLGANLPPIEAATHAAVERTRIMYRDHPVPGVCQWPDRVQAELYQARQRANGAASRL